MLEKIKARKILWGAIALAAAVIVCFATGLFNSGLAVEAYTVQSGTVKDTFKTDGIVKRGARVNMLSPVAGGITQLYVAEGTYVDQGEVIAEIDPADYHSQIAAYNASIAAYRAEKAALQTSEQLRRSDLENELKGLRDSLAACENSIALIEQKAADRGQSLLAEGAISQSEKDAADAALLSKRAEAEALRADIAAAQKRFSADEYINAAEKLDALISAEEANLATLHKKVTDCTVRAPVAGYISYLPIKSQTRLEEGAVIAAISEDDIPLIHTEVLTSNVVYLQVGDSVTVKQKLKNGDRVYTGKIKEIYSFAQETISALGLKEHKVEVITALDDANDDLRDGYEVEVEFTVLEKNDVLFVPNSALFEQDGADRVFVIEGQTAVSRPVVKGDKTTAHTVITAGLAAGEVVIANAAVNYLEDGSKVHVDED